MAVFFYKAKNYNSEIIQGQISALNLDDAANKLEGRGLTVIELSQISKNNFKKLNYTPVKITKFSVKEKKEFFNALYFQYKSGISICETLKSIQESTSDIKIRNLCVKVTDNIEKGYSLKEAFSGFEDALSPAYTTLLCAGEESGKLDEVLDNITKTLNKEEEILNSLKSSFAYPVFIFFLAIGVFLFFKMFVFKAFESSFEGISQNDISALLIGSIIKIIFFYLFCAGIITIIIKNESLKDKIINIISRLSIFKKLINYYYFQNFFTVLSLSYSAGISLIDSLALADTVLKIEDASKKIKKSLQRISKGCEFTTALALSGIFSDYVMSQISSGEKSGTLDKSFMRAALDYENKLDTNLKIMTKLTEPILIIFVGLMVLYVAFSLYSKYFNSLFSMF